MEKKLRNYIICLLSYLYIAIGYSYIIYFISYYVRIANKPLGWAYMVAIALIYLIVYTVINHIFIRRVISNKLLIIIEVLLFVSMLTLIISDLRYEEYLHYKYILSHPEMR